MALAQANISPAKPHICRVVNTTPTFHSSISKEKVHEVFPDMKLLGPLPIPDTLKIIYSHSWNARSKISHLKHPSGLG